jgi:hypothetical protein
MVSTRSVNVGRLKNCTARKCSAWIVHALLATAIPLASCAAEIGAPASAEENRDGEDMKLPTPPRDARTPDEPLPRPGDIAIREEFDAAARKGTAEAWELFIARHPGHALAAQARKRLLALRGD